MRHWKIRYVCWSGAEGAGHVKMWKHFGQKPAYGMHKVQFDCPRALNHSQNVALNLLHPTSSSPIPPPPPFWAGPLSEGAVTTRARVSEQCIDRLLSASQAGCQCVCSSCSFWAASPPAHIANPAACAHPTHISYVSMPHRGGRYQKLDFATFSLIPRLAKSLLVA